MFTVTYLWITHRNTSATTPATPLLARL